MNILIADDHDSVREGVEEIIRGLPDVESIAKAADGLSAWNKLISAHYDLAILDISMPGLSGLDILQQLKKNSINTPVLLYSLYPQGQYSKYALKLGASGYLSKGSIFEELGIAIRRIQSGETFVSQKS